MNKADTAVPVGTDPRLKAMISDSIQMLDELSKLTIRLTQVSDAAAEKAVPTDDVGEMERELKGLQERLTQLSGQVKVAARSIDQQVRQSPYLFAGAALGLGFLLGKARRL
ncbi:MAG: hypothetical protein FJ146_09420 [Deltaproteobacteria bacterium]|nr:hypothetical protein [Deltaproteobacteria bacterium]